MTSEKTRELSPHGPPPAAGTSHKEADESYLGGRLPLINTADLNDAQRELYEYLVQTKLTQFQKAGITGQLEDGRLIGPFNAFLYRPSAARAFNGWMDAQSLETSISSEVSQIVILTVGAVWQSPFELYAHTAAARKAGVSDQAIEALLAGREPGELSTKAKVAYRFTHELVNNKSIVDSTYAEAVAAFGVSGVVDLVNLICYYLATVALLNAFSIPAPAVSTGTS